MSSLPAWPLWNWQLATAILFSVASALLIWAIWGDRSKGRRRCPKCWYDMSGISWHTCPECGKAAKSELHFFKTRRRRKSAVVACIGLAAALAVHAAPRVIARGWIALMPFRCLVMKTERLARADAQLHNQIRRELDSCASEVYFRSHEREIWWWDRAWLGERILAEVIPAKTLFFRDSLVTELPIGIVLSLPMSVALPGDLDIELHPLEGFTVSNAVAMNAERFNGGFGSWGLVGTAELPVPLPAATRLAFQLVLIEKRSGTIWATKRIDQAVRFVNGVNDLIQPWIGTTPCHRGFSLAFRGTQAAGIDVDIGDYPGGICGSSAGMAVDFVYNGEVRATYRRFISATELGRTIQVEPSQMPYSANDSARRTLESLQPDPADPAWTVVIRGDPTVAYQHPLATNYWVVNETFSLADIMARGAWYAPY